MPTELLGRATLGGADAHGLADTPGSLEPGKLAALTSPPLDAPSPDERGDPDAVLAALAAGRITPTALPATAFSA